VVVGGGPAGLGLVAACYLARCQRRFLLVDASDSRTKWIPTSHDTPGYGRGIHGPELLKRLRAQLS
jgi:thioredoxin reductase (NADPH)